MKNENKIRKLLGKDYHLGVYHKFVNPYDTIIQWKLYKNYDDVDIYFSNDNKPIMDSEHNTTDELLEFAKTHHKIDEHKAFNLIILILLFILFILAVINIFISKKELRYIILSNDLILMIEITISNIIYNHNWKVKMKNVIEKNVKKSD